MRKNPLPTGLKALVLATFLGVLNNTLFRFIVSLIAIDSLMPAQGIFTLCLTEAIFILPYILFSPYVGALSDRKSKSSIIQLIKLTEVMVFILGGLFLYFQSITGLVCCILVLGTLSTVYSPNKYGAVPELVEEDQLTKGNGYLEFATFLAILLGTALGGKVKELVHPDYYYVGIICLVIALSSLIASLFITKLTPKDTEAQTKLNGFAEIYKIYLEIKQNKPHYYVMWSISLFWTFGALARLNTTIYSKNYQGFTDTQVSYVFLGLAVGLGLGSIVAGRLSLGKVDLGLTIFGAMGMGLSSLFLGIFTPGVLFSALLCLALGISSGLTIVPLDAYFQKIIPEKKRGRYLATGNFVCFLVMLPLCFLPWVLISLLSFSPVIIYLLLAATAIGLALFSIIKSKEISLQFLNFLVTRAIYKLSINGQENIPKTGGALLVCNHVSYIDPLILTASTDRPIRFLVYRPIYNKPIINFVCRAMKAIPIAEEDSPKELVKSLTAAREAIKNGELVCIFAEGGLTRLGRMLPFSRGLEKVVKNTEAPIIPIFLDQIWGSLFSFKNGKFFWKLPQELPYPASVNIGSHLHRESQAFEVRQKVQELGAEAAQQRLDRFQLLNLGFIRNVKKFLFRKSLVDSSGKKLTYLETFIASNILSRRLNKQIQSQKMVGVILPASVGGAISNIALTLSGHIPINLNFTSGQSSLSSAIKQCEIKTIITSKLFLEKLQLDLSSYNCEIVFLEDTLKDISKFEKFKSLLLLLYPSRMLAKKLAGRKINSEDLATIIFSSGSTAEPKGVMLSHGNICSNIKACYEVFQLNKKDAIIGVLPFFHSFGYTATLWLPIMAGVTAVYHPNPLDAQAIASICKKHQGTILLSTPSFLLNYIRKCEKEDFLSLRMVVVGAEKLRERIANSFKEKFGLEPLEGYGCTELSPVAMFNIPDYEDKIIKQTGQKFGTVGHPIPGVAAKVVDLETFEQLNSNEQGMLLIKGPNVMLGYLNNQEKTSEVISEGWYITGDLAKIDDEGFVTILDRLVRFSKIAGEMVPHIKIEEEIHAALKITEHVCVVTAVGDEKKGEKLIVLHINDLDVDSVLNELSSAGLPNLWIPKKDNFYKIEAIPLLGSGKLDLKAVKEISKTLADT